MSIRARLNHPDLAGSQFQPSRDQIPGAHVTDHRNRSGGHWGRANSRVMH
jgi:hypothetical protein